MKSLKYFITLFFIAVTMLLNGCKKSLELAPYNSISDAVAFETPEKCLLALYGVYDAAQSGDYDPLNGSGNTIRGYPFGAASIEQGEMRGEDMVNTATFYQLTYLSLYSPVSPNNVNMWINLYRLINKANLSIDGFNTAASKGIITPAAQLQYLAECRFLRGMAHHELLLHFSRPYLDGAGSNLGVPFHDFAISSTESLDRLKTLPRGTVAECYTKILADLDYAETNLGTAVPITVNGSTLPPGVNNIRATKAAAIAIKMRVKMHKGDWSAATGVMFEGNKLIPATPNMLAYPGFVSPIGGWKLEALPNGAFTSSASLESIFSIKNDALDNPGGNAALAQMLGPNNPGRGLVAIGPTIYNLPTWRCDDTRRTLLTLSGNINGSMTLFSFFTKKYTDYVNNSDNAPLIRYAEVLLMQAEAEARVNGITTKALQLLNEVRNRALPGGPGNFTTPPANTYTAASFANTNAFIKAILEERRIEFLAEGKRWGDIHRLANDPIFTTNGIPAKAGNGYNNSGGTYGCALPIPPLAVLSIAYSDYRFLWPIPQDEIVQNPIVKQNPGY